MAKYTSRCVASPGRSGNRRLVGRFGLGHDPIGPVCLLFLENRPSPIGYFHTQTKKHAPAGKVDLQGFPHSFVPYSDSRPAPLILAAFAAPEVNYDNFGLRANCEICMAETASAISINAGDCSTT